VIAGLVQDMASKNFDKVPWMGDLPVLGPLFRSKDFNNQRTELVIFVTPYVSDVGASVDQARLERAAKIQKNFDEIVKGTQLLE
jgi:pilus assembly protein CpaC